MTFPDHETKEDPSSCYLERLVDNAVSALENVGAGEFDGAKEALLESLEILHGAMSESHFDMASATVETMIYTVKFAQNPYEVGVALTPRHLRGVMVQADAELRRRCR